MAIRKDASTQTVVSMRDPIFQDEESSSCSSYEMVAATPIPAAQSGRTIDLADDRQLGRRNRQQPTAGQTQATSGCSEVGDNQLGFGGDGGREPDEGRGGEPEERQNIDRAAMAP